MGKLLVVALLLLGAAAIAQTPPPRGLARAWREHFGARARSRPHRPKMPPRRPPPRPKPSTANPRCHRGRA